MNSQPFSVPLFLKFLLLGPIDDHSAWTTFLLWSIRIISFSLLFRTYIGPSILRLISSRLRVRSVSLRSIRGIYFRTGTGTWRVDRVGISYHRPSSEQGSRFSIKVEGLKLELNRVDIPRTSFVTPGSRNRTKFAEFSPSPLARHSLAFITACLSATYTFLDPYVRPVIRAVFVAVLRLIIRALPALTHVLDFELDSALVTFSALPGARLALGEAKLHTRMSLTYMESVVYVDDGKVPYTARHKRFASVADWNARVKSSLRRTWERAWGATQVAASVSLAVKNVTGNAYETKFPNVSETLFTGHSSDRAFVDIPSVTFAIAVRFNPHQGIENHTVETTLDLGTVDVDVDVVKYLLNAIKGPRGSNQEIPRREVRSPLLPSTSPPSSSRIGWKSPLSPTSPLIGALSASMRWKRAARQSAIRKVKDIQSNQVNRLSALKSINIRLARLTASHRPPGSSADSDDVFKTIVKNIQLDAGLSDPATSPLHKQWLGSSHRPDDALTVDAFFIRCSVDLLNMDRDGSGAVIDHLRVLSVGPLGANALISQWPSPWSRASSFLSGDPNAQVLMLNIVLGTIQVTERLELLQRYMTPHMPHSVPPAGSSSLPSMLSPMPRVEFGCHIGEVCVRLISSTSDNNQGPFVLEARTNSIVASMSSRFQSRPDRQFGDVLRDHAGLQMDYSFAFILSQSFLNVWYGPGASSRGHDAYSITSTDYPNEAVLRLETIQLTGDGNAFGEFVDEVQGVVILDLSSTFTDLQCCTDAISVELWQPEVIKALSRLVAFVSNRPKKTNLPLSTPRLLDKLPLGLSASLSVGRFMVFVTSPDLAPDEALNISRGVAAHMGICIAYRALRSRHPEGMPDIQPRNQQRLLLSLPAERISHTSAASSTAPTTRALLQVAFWNIALRDAIATRFAADDPYGVGDSSDHLRSLEYFRIQNIETTMIISGTRFNGVARSTVKDNCSVDMSIYSVRGLLHLAHVYNLLLALRTLTSLSPPSTSRKPSTDTPSTLSFDARCSLDSLQLRWDFPILTKMFARVRSLTCQISPELKIEVGWSSIVLAVSILVTHDGIETEEWEELARLPRWNVDIQPQVRPVAIIVKGDNGCLRIPFDYVVADLILDINVTMKSIKHLVRMVSAGHFYDPPTPEAEDAKLVPNIAIQLNNLTLEAADDYIETKLGLIWRTGFDAARIRLEREDAFRAKVATIQLPESPTAASASREVDSDFQFTPNHTVSIADAWERLSHVHAYSWQSAHRKALSQQTEREEAYLLHSGGSIPAPSVLERELVFINPLRSSPPLARLAFDELTLHLSPPAFPPNAIPDFLHTAGRGLPRDTRFSLLIPMHINFTVASFRLSCRDYPLPLLNIPPSVTAVNAALEFDTDLVIAEEMGTEDSVEWIPCEIVKPHSGLHGASPLSISVPKTIMPVKTYANPIIRVMTDGVTDFGWGVSYGAATQDLMRIIDTLSHAPRDSSPPIGFWDKLRLVFHWRVKVFFKHEVHLHMKGSRDPHETEGAGAGFALCWTGHPQLLIGQPNDAGELVQVVSDSMLVVIPNVEDSYSIQEGVQEKSKSPREGKPAPKKLARKCPKVCAKFRSGVCFGVGFVLERACGPECPSCTGKAFERQCRLFDFRPHYDVRLENKVGIPELKSTEDSYNGFRSDFIHMSISLTSGTRRVKSPQSCSLHLSPEVFAHFWSWWSLFDGVLSLPIRQGNLYSRKRPVSPKFGQHLATLKYRVSVPQLFISHAYIDNSKDAWTDGVTPFIGVKALINQFQADMHQRDQETSRMTLGGVKTIHHKPFYAVEVVMKGLDLRAMLAVFLEPLKESVAAESPSFVGEYRTRHDLHPVDLGSPWIDLDDFVDNDWLPSTEPTVHLLPAASCPRFTYFKRTVDRDPSAPESQTECSKFGAEDTHVCFLGKEPSVSQIQIDLASARVKELQQKTLDAARAARPQGMRMSSDSRSENERTSDGSNDLPRMISLLQSYISQLRAVDAASHASSHGSQNYYMPADSVSPEEWAEFDNVYQVYCPQIIMDNAIRDIMMQYYYCSRSRRGFEYHMATRAVKFIRDQAQAALAEFQRDDEKHRGRGPAANAQAAAAVAVRKLLGSDRSSSSFEVSPKPLSDSPASLDPLQGWSDGVSLRKSHFCLLLKPQVVLRSEASTESVCILAAVQGKLKAYAIMDDSNADDPVSGKVMTRNFAWLNGLQTFSPSATNTSGEGYVPLEVLIDLRCENSAFDRLVPQTDATFQYDKFNRLRLRNNVTSVTQGQQHHLQNQTDLIRLHVPRFTISANDRHFQAISNIVTDLVLYSDVALKARSEKLEKMLFSYDFTNLASAADVVTNMQQRLRHALETKWGAEQKLRSFGEPGQIELLKIDAHILFLVEELNLTFDAIKLAQDKIGEHSDQKSALLLHASSNEVSWRMLDRHDQLLAKLAVRNIDFYWLNRHDSSTVNKLAVGDLQAFDGAADADWTEILSKYDEPSTHPLVKRKLFLVSDWTVLPPVGGITIYETFELMLHPMRLQIDTRVGRKIMEYVWPARRNRQQVTQEPESFDIPDELSQPAEEVPKIIYGSPRHASFDLPQRPRRSLDTQSLTLPSPLRKLGASRSFTDLRNSARQDSLQVPRLHKTHSTDTLAILAKPSHSPVLRNTQDSRDRWRKEVDDAAEMKTRASQKTFVRVKVASLHLLLSIMKEDSFLCRNARIRTRDLEYRNQTWSFEELVDQFIPSGRNWRGWVKVAFQQPLVPVLPVARELITKTKWIASKGHQTHERHGRFGPTRILSSRSSTGRDTTSSEDSPQNVSPKEPRSSSATPEPAVLPYLTGEPESMPDLNKSRGVRRPRMISLFKRRHANQRESVDSDTSGSTTSSPVSRQEHAFEGPV